MRKLAARLSVVIVAAGLALSAAPTGAAQAVPVQGTGPWSVLLCKLSDVATEPHAPQHFREMLTSAGTGKGGVQDYFDSQSGGRLWLGNSAVSGWHTLPFTTAVQKAKSRDKQVQDCIDAAKADGYTVPAGNRIFVVVNARIGAGSTGKRVLMDPPSYSVGFAAHEMLHSYGMHHSYSDDTTFKLASWSGLGEYDDPWDQMSAMNIYTFQTARFGTSAVGLNAYQRDKLGWLPRSQIVNFGPAGAATRTMTLAPLELLTGAGARLVRIPFATNDPHRYYTVEFRKKTGWSAGIPGDTVLIHEVKGGRSYLLRDRTTRDPVQTLAANGVTITVGAISGNSASVQVKSTTAVTGVNGPNACKAGFVWRAADETDYVCVTPAVRAETQEDNASQDGRWTTGPFGSRMCKPVLYVKRGAFSGDDMCVRSERREQALADNAAAGSRVAAQ